MKCLRHILILIVLNPILATANIGDQLIIFTDNTSVVSQDFIKTDLPKLQKLCEEMKVQLINKDISAGAPEEITYTPSIVFQNAKGRSFFKGRYKLVSKVKTFIRTVKFIPQQAFQSAPEDILVWKSGRQTILLKGKVTDIVKAKPATDYKITKEQIKKKLYESFPSFKLSKGNLEQRMDRKFYFSAYPYISKSGTMHISLEIYSQYHCVDPIYKQNGSVFYGKVKSSDKLLTKVAENLESKIKNQMITNGIGDAFEPIQNKVSTKDWNELGLRPLEIETKGSDMDISALPPVPKEWVYDGPLEEGISPVQFSFPPPVDSYSGVVNKLSGSIILDEKKTMKGATGSFIADLTSLTMGDESLDEVLFNDVLLTKKHPSAKLTFNMTDGSDNPLKIGEIERFAAVGEMEFMSIKSKVNITSEAQVITFDGKELKLRIFASFKMRLKEKYNIEGPDGPDPEKDTLVFNLNFLMKSKN